MEITDNNSDVEESSHEAKNDDQSNTTESEGDDDDGIKDENKRFSHRSISVTASSIGISSVSEEVCRHIAEELYYKTKELIYVSKLILNQNKRSTLTTNDVKKAMKLLGGVEVYGHNSTEEVNYVHIPKADIYVEEDTEIEIDEETIADSTYSLNRKPYIRGGWIMPEGYAEDPSIVTPCTYYRRVAQTILSGSPGHLRVALSDLRTNPKIGPTCPYFLNLVAITVKKVPRDIPLTNALIGTVHAIAHNKFVDPSPFVSTNRAVESLLEIAIGGNVNKIGDHFVDNDDDLTVRMRAGILLAKVVTMWSIELKQQIAIVRHLLQHLVNPDVPLQSHYGAIVTLTTLGQRKMDYFWPVVEKFLALLQVKINAQKNNSMVRHVMTAILVAARNTYKKDSSSNPEQLQQLYQVDTMLYSSFGDSVIPLRLVTSPPIFKCLKSPVQQSRLKLRICRTNPDIDSSKRQGPIDVCSVFNISKRLSKISTSSVNKEKPDFKKFVYPCVKRNYKFCQPLHTKSASGDLLLML